MIPHITGYDIAKSMKLRLQVISGIEAGTQARKNYLADKKVQNEKNKDALLFLIDILTEEFPEHDFSTVFEQWKKTHYMRAAVLAHTDIKRHFESLKLPYPEEQMEKIQFRLRDFIASQ